MYLVLNNLQCFMSQKQPKPIHMNFICLYKEDLALYNLQ